MKKQPIHKVTDAIITVKIHQQDDELHNIVQEMPFTSHITHTRQHADLILKSHRENFNR